MRLADEGDIDALLNGIRVSQSLPPEETADGRDETKSALPRNTRSAAALSARVLQQNAERVYAARELDPETGTPRRSRWSFRLLVLSLMLGAGFGLHALSGHFAAELPPANLIAAGLSPDGSTLTALRKHGFAENWDLRTGQRQSQIRVDRRSHQVLSAGPNRVLLFSRTDVYQWRPQDDFLWSAIRPIPMPDVGVVQRVIPGGSDRTAFLLGGHIVTILDLKSMDIVRRVDVGPAAPLSSAASPARELIVCSDRHGNVGFWSAASGRQLFSLSFADFLDRSANESPIVSSIAIDADGEFMALAFRSGYIQLWDMETMQLVRSISLSPPATRLAFRPRSTTLIAGSRGSLIVLKEQMQQRAVIKAAGMDDPEWMEVSTDGTLVAAFSSDDKDLWIFDLESMRLSRRLKAK